MILTWIFVTLVWASLVAACDLNGLVLPDIALALSIWAGLRHWRRDEDLTLALSLGLVSGLFSVDPWFLASFICLVAVVSASSLRQRVAPQSLPARSILILLVFLIVAGIECLMRMSVPSLNLNANTIFGIGCRTFASVPLVIILDQVTPQRS